MKNIRRGEKLKKIIILCLAIFFITGCASYNEKSIVKDLNKKINKINAYHIEGNMEIYNGDDVYKYDVKSSYENDKYRVSLINKTNNHEQIILRNDDGVYVLTPSLNKSFKFQSNWPDNSSQVYILKSLQNDINEDKKIKLEDKNGIYILTTKLANTNNKNLVKQKIYLDKNLNITKVEVLDNEDNMQIKMIYNSFDTKATFNDKYFSVSENMKVAEKEESKTTMNTLEDAIYPMYLPSGTYLSNEETIKNEGNNRKILSFQGESPFILVEETASMADDLQIIPVYGDPTMIVDTIGALSDSSVNFITNGVEYYIASESLTTQEIIQVAKSISSLPVMK